MIDANANRAAEALRTLEDVARFVLQTGPLAARLKEIRHTLRQTIASIDALSLAAARDAINDPGAAPGAVDSSDASAVTRSPLATRRDAREIAAAAGSRAGEALRALEEALRVTHGELAVRIERLRFDCYDAAAQVTMAAGTGTARQWRCCLILTESLCRRPWREVLRAALHAGVDCVQLREKTIVDSELLDRAREVVAMARAHRATVFINDRADVAIASGADGVHLGTDDLPIRDVRALGGGLLIGASTHDLREADAAITAGADCCGVGAMFTTTTKPDRKASGIAYLRAFVTRFPSTPHLAIGGITAERIPELAAAGCRGVAVSGAICSSDDPGAATAAIIAGFEAVHEVQA